MNTIIRSVVALLVAIFDLLKVCFGVDFGIDSEGVYAFITFVVGVWVWWKNNSFTIEAKTADKFMKELKTTRKVEWETVEEPSDAEVK